MGEPLPLGVLVCYLCAEGCMISGSVYYYKFNLFICEIP